MISLSPCTETARLTLCWSICVTLRGGLLALPRDFAEAEVAVVRGGREFDELLVVLRRVVEAIEIQ